MFCPKNLPFERFRQFSIWVGGWSLLLALVSFAFGHNSLLAQEGAATPGECIEQSLTGMLDGNWDTFSNVTHCETLLEQKLQKTLFRFASAGDRFRTKFIASYGEEAWKTFNDPNHLPYEEGAAAGGNGSITVLERSAIPQLVEEANQNATDTESSTSIPNTTDRMKLIKRDGRWFLASQSLLGNIEQADAANLINLLGNVSVEIERFENAIGLEGITPDDIDFEFGVASLAAMGMNIPAANSRFDTESLPQPEPFEEIGDPTPLISLDFETFKKYQDSATTLGNTFLKDSPEAFIQLLAPEVQGLVDPQTIESLRNRVRSRWGDAAEFTITDLNFDQTTGYELLGTIGTEQDTAQFSAFGTGEKWIGIAIEADQFGIDTCNVERNIESYFEESENFFNHFINGETEAAFRIMFDGAEPSGAEFDNFVNNVPEGLKLLEQTRIGARVFGSDQNRRLRIMTLVKVQEGEEIWLARCANDFAFTDEGWDFVEYDSGFIGGGFVLNDHSNAEAFLHAMGNGDTEACLELFHEDMRAQVQPSVFKAFCRDFHETFGKFKSIDLNQFQSKANFEEETPGIFSTGKVEFENHVLTFSSRHILLGIVSFNLEMDIEKADHATKIEDFSELDAYSQRFVELLLTKPAESLDLTSSELRSELPDPEAWAESLKEFLAENGAPQTIRQTSSKLDEETGYLRYEYEVECEKRTLAGYVELRFDAIRSFVDEFSINAVEQNAPATEPVEDGG